MSSNEECPSQTIKSSTQNLNQSNELPASESTKDQIDLKSSTSGIRQKRIKRYPAKYACSSPPKKIHKQDSQLSPKCVSTNRRKGTPVKVLIRSKEIEREECNMQGKTSEDIRTASKFKAPRRKNELSPKIAKHNNKKQSKDLQKKAISKSNKTKKKKVLTPKKKEVKKAKEKILQRKKHSPLLKVTSPGKRKESEKRKAKKGERKRKRKHKIEDKNSGVGNKSSRSFRGKYSVTGSWYIASGYLNDIISLLEEFESIDGWRFKDYSKCWQKKKFSLVYRGRQTFKELLEFSEEIALLTKRFLHPPHSNKRRIGALYTLYGLYFKHPVGRFFNIRLELQEYKDLLELIQPFRSNPENPDPAFIFKKLEIEGAIHHCASSLELCFTFNNEARRNVDLEYGKQRLAKSSAVDVSLPKFQVNADLSLLDHYNKIKAKVSGTNNEPERSLSMLAPNFMKEVEESLISLKNRTLESLQVDFFTKEEIIQRSNGLDEASEIEQSQDDIDGSFDTVNTSISESTAKSFKDIVASTADISNFHNLDVYKFMEPSKVESQLLDCIPTTTKQKCRVQFDLTMKDVVTSKSIDASHEPPLNAQHYLDKNTFAALMKQKRAPKRSKLLRKAQTMPVNHRLTSKITNDSCLPTLDLDLNSAPQETSKSKSSTEVLASELHVISSYDSQEKETISMKVLLSSDETMRVRKIKVKVSLLQWNDIQNNERRLENFKKRLLPLLISDNEKDLPWVIEEIRPETIENEPEVPIERSPSPEVKEAVDEPYCDSPEESHSSSEEDEEDEEEFFEDYSPNRKRSPSKKTSHRTSYLNGMRDNSLITSDCDFKLRMEPIKIGDKIRHIPICNEAKNADRFHSWNDFSSTKPPLLTKVKKEKPFTIVYPAFMLGKRSSSQESTTPNKKFKHSNFVSGENLSYIKNITSDLCNGIPSNSTPINKNKMEASSGTRKRGRPRKQTVENHSSTCNGSLPNSTPINKIKSEPSHSTRKNMVENNSFVMNQATDSIKFSDTSVDLSDSQPSCSSNTPSEEIKPSFLASEIDVSNTSNSFFSICNGISSTSTPNSYGTRNRGRPSKNAVGNHSSNEASSGTRKRGRPYKKVVREVSATLIDLSKSWNDFTSNRPPPRKVKKTTRSTINKILSKTIEDSEHGDNNEVLTVIEGLVDDWNDISNTSDKDASNSSNKYSSVNVANSLHVTRSSPRNRNKFASPSNSKSDTESTLMDIPISIPNHVSTIKVEPGTLIEDLANDWDDDIIAEDSSTQILTNKKKPSISRKQSFSNPNETKPVLEICQEDRTNDSTEKDSELFDEERVCVVEGLVNDWSDDSRGEDDLTIKSSPNKRVKLENEITPSQSAEEKIPEVEMVLSENELNVYDENCDNFIQDHKNGNYPSNSNVIALDQPAEPVPLDSIPPIEIDLQSDINKPLYYMLKDGQGNSFFIPLPYSPSIINVNSILPNNQVLLQNTCTAEQACINNDSDDTLSESHSKKMSESPLRNINEVSTLDRNPAPKEEFSVKEELVSPLKMHEPYQSVIQPSPKPNCSFFISKKFKSLQKLTSAAGNATGKPPPPIQTPKVKFLMKGLFSKRKKNI